MKHLFTLFMLRVLSFATAVGDWQCRVGASQPAVFLLHSSLSMWRRLPMQSRQTESSVSGYHGDLVAMENRTNQPIVSCSACRSNGLVWLETYRHISCQPSHYADLSGANLARADLEFAKLQNANLANFNLSRADLVGADLSDANLAGADFTETDLASASCRTRRRWPGPAIWKRPGT
jgi:hypothetical protein